MKPDEDIVVRAVLTAIHRGSFIDDREFATRLGGTRDELAAILRSWPDVNDGDVQSIDYLLINNCFNEICHGLPIADSEWQQWFSVPRARVAKVYETWQTAAQQ